MSIVAPRITAKATLPKDIQDLVNDVNRAIALLCAGVDAALRGAGLGENITDSTFTMATGYLLGRTTAAEGAIEEISIGSNLTMATGTLVVNSFPTFIEADIGVLVLDEQSGAMPDPDEGETRIWMSDGSGPGDDGDIMVKITAGGVTKTTTLIDFSALP